MHLSSFARPALLNAATGAGYTPEEVERIGERVFNAVRLFLLAAGFTRRGDTLLRISATVEALMLVNGRRADAATRLNSGAEVTLAPHGRRLSSIVGLRF
jgi:hypothetical protein